MIKNIEKINILGVDIHLLTMSETVNEVEEKYIIPKKPLHLIGVNADKINQCVDSMEMMNIVNNCGIINADGGSVVLAGKYLGLDIPERVAGIDLMQELLSLAELKGYSVYFLGARKEILQTMINKLCTIYPKLDIVGSKNGYFLDSELDQIKNEIKKSGAKIVFVGITSPKKEYIIEYFISEGINSVFMGVGGSFDVLSGSIKRAPLWMQKIHMEWFFRVINEPKRLFKRYFWGNIKFIKRIICYKKDLYR